jgi:hypothetical protein
LGFIRYSKAKGTLELTNFKAQLERKALDQGFTTKRDKKQLAGTHGEGFKVASLVMLRQGHQVRYEASKCYWNFRFGGSENHQLYCGFQPITETLLQKQMAAYHTKVKEGTSRELKANIWEDVSVKIGQVFRSKANKIKMADFKEWLKVSLDLDHPSKVIETALGSLILDPRFKGRIYLKGLLLENNKNSKFGYNLYYGFTNRDRQMLTNQVLEAKVLARIWEEAIEVSAVDTLHDYVTMLWDDEQWADVNLAKDHISKATANKIWQHLLGMDPWRKYFYHDDRNGDKVRLFSRLT